MTTLSRNINIRVLLSASALISVSFTPPLPPSHDIPDFSLRRDWKNEFFGRKRTSTFNAGLTCGSSGRNRRGSGSRRRRGTNELLCMDPRNVLHDFRPPVRYVPFRPYHTIPSSTHLTCRSSLGIRLRHRCDIRRTGDDPLRSGSCGTIQWPKRIYHLRYDARCPAWWTRIWDYV